MNPVDWSGRHVDSCGIAAAELRPRRRDDEEAQRRPAESEVPGTQINSPLQKGKFFRNANKFVFNPYKRAPH
jgi:hypothetical protein